jgi:hypothetical protein
LGSDPVNGKSLNGVLNVIDMSANADDKSISPAGRFVTRP